MSSTVLLEQDYQCSSQSHVFIAVADVDIFSRQRVVTELLTAGGCSPSEIRTCVRSMCGAETIDVSSFRLWVCQPTSVEKDIGGRLCSGQPTTALKTQTKDKVDVLIWDDCHIMTNELCTAGGI